MWRQRLTLVIALLAEVEASFIYALLAFVPAECTHDVVDQLLKQPVLQFVLYKRSCWQVPQQQPQ
jgi:hypothetical protein